MTVKRSDNKKGVIEYQCDRGGSYKNSHHLADEQRIRDTGTLRRDCPFAAKAKLRNGLWTLQVLNADHNHAASTGAVDHATLRSHDIRQSEADIVALSRAGVKPR
jgi:hypothetical protein